MKRSVLSFFLIGIFFTSCSGAYPKAIVVDPEPIVFSPTELTQNQTPVLIPTPAQVLPLGVDVIQTATKIDLMLINLYGLSLNEFYDQSFVMWISRDPELVTAMGLDEVLGIKNDQLTDISEVYTLETERLERGILDLLNTYNRDELDEEGKLNYDIYHWFFEDRVEGQQYRHLTYLIHNYPYTSIQNQFVQLMVLFHPMQDRQDIEDYLSRLNKVDIKVNQILDELKIREEMGVVPPRIVLVDAINQINEIIAKKRTGGSRPEDIILYQIFTEKLDSIDTIPEVEKIEYSREVLRILDEKFIPSYRRMAEYLTLLLEEANDDGGVWKLNNGEAYYQYLIHHFTSQDLTAEQVFTLGGIYAREDRQALIKYLVTNNLIESEGDVSSFSKELFEGFGDYQNFTMQETNPYYEVYLNFFDESKYLIHINFQTIPTIGLLNSKQRIGFTEVHNIKDPLFDLTPQLFNITVDYTGISLRSDYYANYVPGIAYQKSFMDNPEWPLFRKYLRFSGYAEGWSNYVLSLMTELKGYGENPLETVYKLEHDLFLSSSVVIDSGIHQQGWSLGEGSLYLEDQVGLVKAVGNDSIERYTVMPAQVLAYRLGSEKFLQLRYYVEDELGPKFSMADYHEWLLSLGDMPLEILEDQVELYVQQQLALDTTEPIP